MSLSQHQIEQLWVSEGGDPRAAHIASAIALAESSGNADAVNHNTNGTTDRGLFQINSIHGAQSTNDLRRNVRAAIAISGNGRNWTPWTTFNTGAYRQHLHGGASPAVGALSPAAPSGGGGDARSAIIGALLAQGTGHVKGSIHQNLLGHAVSLMHASTPTPTHTDVQTVAHPGVAQGGGTLDHFDGKPVAGWIAAELRWARSHGWTGTVTSGYRSFADQQRIYNSGVRPAAKPGTSNHEFTAYPGGAVDVSNAQQLAQILAKKPGGSKLVYAGAKDPVHFSHPHNGGY